MALKRALSYTKTNIWICVRSFAFFLNVMNHQKERRYLKMRLLSHFKCAIFSLCSLTYCMAQGAECSNERIDTAGCIKKNTNSADYSAVNVIGCAVAGAMAGYVIAEFIPPIASGSISMQSIMKTTSRHESYFGPTCTLLLITVLLSCVWKKKKRTIKSAMRTVLNNSLRWLADPDENASPRTDADENNPLRTENANESVLFGDMLQKIRDESISDSTK